MIEAVLSSIATRTPDSHFTTERLLDAAGDRFTPELRKMIQDLGIFQRSSILANLDDVLFDNATPEWAVLGADLAVRIARDCLAKADVPASEIGLVIGVTSTPPRPIPGFVCDIFAQMPELPREAMNVSMQAQGCSVLLKAVETARWYLGANPGRSVLIVCVESVSAMSMPLTSEHYGTFSQCSSPEQLHQTLDVMHAFLFGDGAAAMLLQADGPGPRFGPTTHLTNELASDAELGNVVGGGTNPPAFEGLRPQFTLSKDIGERGAHYAVNTIGRLLASLGRDVAEFPEVMVHTGSKKILDGIRESLGVSTEQARVAYKILAELGNANGASLAMMIESSLREDPTTRRDILLATFGIGFSASAGMLTVSGRQ